MSPIKEGPLRHLTFGSADWGELLGPRSAGRLEIRDGHVCVEMSFPCYGAGRLTRARLRLSRPPKPCNVVPPCRADGVGPSLETPSGPDGLPDGLWATGSDNFIDEILRANLRWALFGGGRSRLGKGLGSVLLGPMRGSRA